MVSRMVLKSTAIRLVLWKLLIDDHFFGIYRLYLILYSVFIVSRMVVV